VVGVDWQLREAGPPEAQVTALLLPGGMCAAGSYAEVMAEPVLGGMRMVAATLPGNAGAPPPDDYSLENYARVTTELATRISADLVVGYSNGASVAFEMVISGLFKGPVVLLGISLSAMDESAFFRGLIQSSKALGTMPTRFLSTVAGSMIKRTALPDARKRELQDDFRKNIPRDTTHALRGYVSWLHRQERPAERLCESGVPAWIVHADKGDGALTDDERSTLEACPRTRVVTIPGNAFFLPNEESRRVAEVIAEAARLTEPKE
jgi:pimeloyl-ACP methyl ester carboxylesterase